LIVRRAVPADVESIARVHVKAWEETYRGLVPDEAFDSYTVEKRVTQWRGLLADPAKLVQVVESDGEVCGFGSAGTSRPGLAAAGEIYSFYLLDAVKHQGNGRRLFARLREELVARDFASLGLWVLANNLPARRFYEAMGGCSRDVRVDRRGDLTFNDIAYLWDDIAGLV
jgi:ribosomal protein S18 acetylase RimI-like enzyme